MVSLTKFPSFWKRTKRKMVSENKVPCEISGRYMEVKEVVSLGAETRLVFDVMTGNLEGRPSKLCEMQVDVEALKHVIEKLESE